MAAVDSDADKYRGKQRLELPISGSHGLNKVISIPVSKFVVICPVLWGIFAYVE